VATRIAGSSDLYQANGRSPANSINFITSHDGFTLADLVSFNEKHNLDNGEHNRDGDNNNNSWNSGIEGPTANKAILRLRSRRQRTMATILLLSQGVPMLVAGDEFGRSQLGNNNAWCQDNPISWLDWSLAKKNRYLRRFFQKLIALRKAHPIFRREDFFPHSTESHADEHGLQITWQGLTPGSQDWSPGCRTLAFLLSGESLTPTDDDFFVMLNMHPYTPAVFTLPLAPRNRHWVRLIDTGKSGPRDFVDPDRANTVKCGQKVSVANMGCVVLQSQP